MDPIRRAERANQLLNDEVLKEAFQAVEQHYLSEWKQSKPSETVKREKLWQAFQTVERVRQGLHQAVADGRVAQANKRKL